MNRRVKSKSKRNQNTRNVRNRMTDESVQDGTKKVFPVLGGGFSKFIQNWYSLPSFHQRAIFVTFIVWLLVIVWPFNNIDDESTTPLEPIIVPIRASALSSSRAPDDDGSYSQYVYEAPVSDVQNGRPRSDFEQVQRPAIRPAPAYEDTGSYDDYRFDEAKPIQHQTIRVSETQTARRVQDNIDVGVDDEMPENWIEHKVSAGENLTIIFKRYGLNLSDLYSISAIEGRGKPISRLTPGQGLRFLQGNEREIERLEIEGKANNPATFLRQHNGKFARID